MIPAIVLKRFSAIKNDFPCELLVYVTMHFRSTIACLSPIMLMLAIYYRFSLWVVFLVELILRLKPFLVFAKIQCVSCVQKDTISSTLSDRKCKQKIPTERASQQKHPACYPSRERTRGRQVRLLCEPKSIITVFILQQCSPVYFMYPTFLGILIIT